MSAVTSASTSATKPGVAALSGSIDTICIGPAMASESEVALPSSGYAAKTAAQ
ncbi:MAG TPA: hypothetical protein PLP95_08410 [Microthrixaceae bacterium]|nr:hypothetical protein [Microthrixaceae bacterium]